jgi:sporulation protein YlmC with PRC-barrel domain
MPIANVLVSVLKAVAMKSIKPLSCATLALSITMWANAQDPGAAIEKDPAKPPRNEESSLSLTAPPARSLVGTPVQTPQGEKLGTVEEVLVDEAGGREFVVLKIGEDKFAALPKAAVSVMLRDKVLVLDRARLEGAPTVGTDWREHVPNDAYEESESYWNAQKHSTQGPPPPRLR